MWRALLLSLSVVGLLLASGGCGTTPPCDASSCKGCCATSGRCLDGQSATACGLGGNACVGCSAGAACSLGVCTSGAGGGGSSTGGGGGTTGGGGGATGGGGGGLALYPDGGSRHAYWDGGACAVKTDCPCFSSDDCGPGFSCVSEDSSGLNVFCKPGARGDGGVGVACTGEADCDSALCVDGSSGRYCSALCGIPEECPAVLPRCTYVGFGIDRALCSP